MSAISILDNQTGMFQVSMGYKDLPYQDSQFTEIFTSMVSACFGAKVSISYDHACTMLNATMTEAGDASRLARYFDSTKHRIKQFGLKPLMIGELRRVKTQRYIVLWEQFITAWGDIAMVCRVLNKPAYEKGVKRVVELSAGSYCCQAGELSHLEMLQRVHKRMKLTHKI